MSFRCQRCGRAVISGERKVGQTKTSKTVVQGRATPTRVVVERYGKRSKRDVEGQIKREENWCAECALTLLNSTQAVAQ